MLSLLNATVMVLVSLSEVSQVNVPVFAVKSDEAVAVPATVA